MKIIKSIPVFFFREDSGKEPVREWLQSLEQKDRYTIGRDIRIVQSDWPIGSPLVKPLGKSLWEIRSKLENRISRIIFIFHDSAIILLHAFIKKTEKTPIKEIELALKRSKKLEGL